MVELAAILETLEQNPDMSERVMRVLNQNAEARKRRADEAARAAPPICEVYQDLNVRVGCGEPMVQSAPTSRQGFCDVTFWHCENCTRRYMQTLQTRESTDVADNGSAEAGVHV